MDKVKTVAQVFELPKLLGIIQQVEYELLRHCADGCLYEGLLTAEGCRKGVCVRYRVRVRSRDGKTWRVKEFGQVNAADWGGCIRQQVADALWELAGRFEVGLWYEYVKVGAGVNQYDVFCGVVVNGVKLYQPHCDSVDECVEQILEDYKREVERMKRPPAVTGNNATEELLRKYPELEAFGAGWVGAWAPHARDRLIEIAEVMHRYPWMVEAVRKGMPDNLNPYAVEAYVSKDGAVVCLSLNQLKTYCVQNGVIKAVKLELEYVRHEMYDGKKRGVYRPKGLLAFSTLAKEYVKIL